MAIFSKLKERLNKNYKESIRSLSQMALPRKEKCKLTLFNRNGKTDASKRRSSGDRNRKCNGLKKGKETQSFFISQSWITGLIIGFQNSEILEGDSSAPIKKWNML